MTCIQKHSKVLLAPGNLVEDVKTIISFLLISFPLTLATGLLIAFCTERSLSFYGAIVIILVAGLLSNLLALIIPNPNFANPDMWLLFKQSSRGTSGSTFLFVWAYKLIAIWWQAYTPLLFIQSAILGGYIGYRLADKSKW